MANGMMEVAGDESYASFLTEGLLLRVLQIVLQPEGNSPLSVVYGEIEEALPALLPFARGKKRSLAICASLTFVVKINLPSNKTLVEE